MRFGVRDICDVTFKAKQDVKIGSKEFKANQPVLYIDSAKTSTLEQATTTVYATGGKGNTRLISWEGEKTLTFTVEDALLSPIGFAILSGAGLFGGNENDAGEVHVHMTSFTSVNGNKIDLSSVLGDGEIIDDNTDHVFVVSVDDSGSIIGDLLEVDNVSGKTITLTSTVDELTNVLVDYYVIKKAKDVSELQIAAGTFGGNYYVEASTLFREQATGKDMPAEITIPNVKIQSNFTFSMAATGDPSTFTFTMDAMPGYTLFDHSKKVLCVIQVVDEKRKTEDLNKSVMNAEPKTQSIV